MQHRNKTAEEKEKDKEREKEIKREALKQSTVSLKLTATNTLRLKILDSCVSSLLSVALASLRLKYSQFSFFSSRLASTKHSGHEA
jgi:hypothetical protein